MKGVRFILIFLIALSTTANIFAQGESMFWYFGNKAGLDFTGGLVNTVGDGEMNTIAGSATMSDWRGNLLFYTNGETVWNKDHVIMENGEGLAGQPDNSQPAIIIRKPGDSNTFYIFTTRIEDKTGTFISRWVYYSVVEFSPSFPLGRITTKNTLLIRSASSERITAVHHEDGRSIWLIALTSQSLGDVNPKNTFSVFNIDSNGIAGTPVQHVSDFNIPTLGVMKISQNGKKIALTGNTPDDDATRWIYMFDFDKTTGQVTDDVRILPDVLPFTPLSANGIEFSPNSEILYYTYKHVTNNVSGIIQIFFDSIGLTSKTTLYEGNRDFLGGMQLANDGKIYVVLASNDGEENDALGVIDAPNEQGFLSNYDPNAIRLSPGASRRGLPTFVQSFFASKIFTENRCVFDAFNFSAESYATISSINWDFGDGNTSSSLNPSHTYTTPGNYSVKAEMVVAGENVLVYKYITVYELPSLIPNQELVQCDTDTDGLSTFNLFNIREKITDPSLEEEMFFYLNYADALAGANEISNPEAYVNTVPNQEIFVRVVNENGCQEFTSFFLRANFVQVDPISPMYTCEFEDNTSPTPIGKFDLRRKRNLIYAELGIPTTTSLTFFETLLDAQTVTNELPIDYDSSSKTIWVRIVGAGSLNCGGLQSFNLVVNPKPVITVADSYSICDDPSVNQIVLTADTSNDRVQWLDSANQVISTQRSFPLNQVGEYTLVAYKTENGLECTNSKTFTVIKYPPPTFVSVDVSETGSSFSVMVNVSGSSSYEFSINGTDFFGNGTSHMLTNVPPGIRTVYVRDLNSCEPLNQREVAIIGYPRFFTPNGDGIFDFWNIKGVSDLYYKSVRIRIYDRYGKSVHEITDFQSIGWDGNYNGKRMPPNDYWFSADIIDLNDNLIRKKGNFSLIRNE